MSFDLLLQKANFFSIFSGFGKVIDEEVVSTSSLTKMDVVLLTSISVGCLVGGMYSERLFFKGRIFSEIF